MSDVGHVTPILVPILDLVHLGEYVILRSPLKNMDVNIWLAGSETSVFANALSRLYFLAFHPYITMLWFRCMVGMWWVRIEDN